MGQSAISLLDEAKYFRLLHVSSGWENDEQSNQQLVGTQEVQGFVGACIQIRVRSQSFALAKH